VPTVVAGGAADVQPPSRVVAFAPGAVAGSGASSPTRVLVPSAMGRWLPSAPPDDPQDASALEGRAAESPERAAELLSAALVLEPQRISALRALCHDPAASPARHLARSLLALVEPDLAPDEPLPAPPRSRVAALLRDPELKPAQAIWALLWEQATPLFRELPARPPEPNARVTRVAMTPEARAFAAALDALGRDDLPELYVERAAEPRLVLTRTAPPSILGGPAFAPDEPSMRFALARLLELSRAESLLVATLAPERAQTVAAAVSAAFGPADGASVAREAAALASELWRTMPARAQVGVRELLIEAGDGWLDVASARRAAEASGRRAGLIACGDLGVAVREACAADRDLASLDLTTERGLIEALASDAIAGLVRFALGPLLG
jgi:hypothetical protein